MKDKGLLRSTFLTILNTVLFIIFVIILFQLNAIEKRYIDLSKKIDILTERVESAPQSNNSSVSSLEPIQPKRKYLHPEVPNFLKKDDFQMRTNKTKVGGVLRRWFPSEPKSFNYIVSNDGELNNYVGKYVFAESLGNNAYMNPDKWVDGLAERIEITNDYKEYTIYLKHGIKWHTPVVDWSNPRYNWLKGDHYLTAKDVKFTFDIIVNPQVECPALRNYYSDLDSVKIIDDYTIVVKWKKKTYNSLNFTVGLQPIPEFLYAYDEDGHRFPKEVAGLKFNNHWYNVKPIGCGPYQFVSYEQGSSLKLKRFPEYYGDKPAIDEIQYYIYPDQKQNLYKLKSGTQDFGMLYPTDYRKEILNGKSNSDFKNGNILNATYNEMVYSYVGWNFEKPLFKDRRVRKALAYAFNLDYMMKNIFMDLGTRITGPIYVNSPAYDKSLPLIPYDLNKARALLAEAGWKDTDGDGILDKVINGVKTKFEFSFLSTSGSPEWTAAQNIYKESLMKIGVKMNISEVDWAVMQKRLEDKDFEAMSGAWGLAWDPDPYQIWHSSQATIPKSSNHISYQNKEVDKVIEELRVTFDKQKRIQLFHKFHRLIYEDQPYIFLFSRKRCAVWWNNLDRVIFSPLRPHSVSLPWYFNSDQPVKH